MILQGDALTWLRQINSETVDCCITSPPYYALRDYKTEGEIWDADPNCEHDFTKHEMRLLHENRNNSEGTNAQVFANPKRANQAQFSGIAGFCKKCNAWKGQLGLEPTFQLYLNHLIQIFTEVKRVLKKTGTCWVVMGDTYAGSGNGANDKREKNAFGANLYDKYSGQKSGTQGIPDKSLLMIPSRFAIQMIDNGWILRNDIIWYKPNCMPSSAKDRFTVDYEHIFFFVKSKQYSFKTQFEPLVENSDVEYRKKLRSGKQYNSKEPYKKNLPYSGKCEKYYFKTQYEPYNWDTESRYKRSVVGGVNNKNEQGAFNYKIERHLEPNNLGRIKRTVWKIAPKPFPEAHFAVFPEELVRQCIEPGCPPNGLLLDPFMGAGTVPLVAEQTHRRWIGIDLNPQYIKIAKERLKPYTQQQKLTCFNSIENTIS